MLGVSVRALKRQPVGTAEEFRLAAMPDALPDIGLDGSAEVQGRLTNLGAQGFLVALAVDAALARECARCLDPVRHEMQVEVEERFAAGAEQQIDGDEVLDLQPLIEEALVLEEPLRVLCSEDCLGLCDRCGQNRNEGTCDCRRREVDPRFEVLRRFAGDGEENR